MPSNNRNHRYSGFSWIQHINHPPLKLGIIDAASRRGFHPDYNQWKEGEQKNYEMGRQLYLEADIRLPSPPNVNCVLTEAHVGSPKDYLRVVKFVVRKQCPTSPQEPPTTTP